MRLFHVNDSDAPIMSWKGRKGSLDDSLDEYKGNWYYSLIRPNQES